MRILLTGAGGFLGGHTRARLRALTDHEVLAVDREAWPRLADLARGVDAIVHVAGVNRGAPAEVAEGNVELARQVAAAARGAGSRPRLVFANSIQAGNETAYGTGKAEASAVLSAAAAELGSVYVDVRLPNLFGENGRARYNSFVATFVEAVVAGRPPEVQDREVALLHAQDAAQALLDSLAGPGRLVQPAGTDTTVQAVLDLLVRQHAGYHGSDVPPLTTKLEIDLFNTLRAALFPAHYPMDLTAHADERGRLVEVVRAHGGRGQTFVSTTEPGRTRGEHFHLTKVERFAVLAGQARISLRRLFTADVVSFDVSGDRPQVVDMPTLWVHDITNTGSTELLTAFWSHDLFDASAPDTFRETVSPAEGTP